MEISFQGFSIFSPGGHLVFRDETILNVLFGSQLGRILMKPELNWPKCLRGVFIYSKLFMFSIFS